MANRTNSLAHTKWLCKYHIVIVPKYRRKIIYYEYRKDLQEIIRTLCRYKQVEIIEGHMMPYHVHLLLSIPPRISVTALYVYMQVNDVAKVKDGVIKIKGTKYSEQKIQTAIARLEHTGYIFA